MSSTPISLAEGRSSPRSPAVAAVIPVRFTNASSSVAAAPTERPRARRRSWLPGPRSARRLLLVEAPTMFSPVGLPVAEGTRFAFHERLAPAIGDHVARHWREGADIGVEPFRPLTPAGAGRCRPGHCTASSPEITQRFVAVPCRLRSSASPDDLWIGSRSGCRGRPLIIAPRCRRGSARVRSCLAPETECASWIQAGAGRASGVSTDSPLSLPGA